MEIKSVALGVVAIMIIAGGLIAVNADKPEDTGNGAPSGQHYNLNIIGVPHGMHEGWEGGNGARIFVDREEPTTFYVYGSETSGFEVKDRDGTDGYVGSGRGYVDAGIIFPYANDAWQVEIYVKLLGPIDSSFKWHSYYWDPEDLSGPWVLISEFTMNRENKKFQLRTDDLLEDGFQDVMWYWDEKSNFKHLQMRIYLT